MRRLDVKDTNTPFNYDEIYFSWRSVQLKAHKYILDLLESLNTKKGNVLDVGCGLGRYLPAFKGSKIFGTELSLKAIQSVKVTYPEATVIQWFDTDSLPFTLDFFDFIWVGELLEHLKNPQMVIDKLYKVLAPGGIILFITPVGESSKCPEHLWFFDDKDIEGFFAKYPNKEIKKIVNNTRFQIILRK